MRRLLTQDGGFGLVELLIAMTVMAIGISAILAGFTSGVVSLNRASRIASAGTLADKQMEAYRALSYNDVRLTNVTPNPTTDSLYTNDPALTGNGLDTGTVNLTSSTCTACTACLNTVPTCKPVQTNLQGPELVAKYRLDTYIVWYCALGTLRTTGTYSQAAPGCLDAGTNAVVARPAKKVTVVVRDNTDQTKVFMRESSTFDQAT